MIVVYLKGTNHCNVGCSHCYLPEAVRANRFRMSGEVMDQTASFLAQMQSRGHHDKTMVIWHGGEPLSLPPEFYFKAGEILDKALPGHLETIQTSLVPFRPEFVPLIRERFDGYIGSSLDFSQRKLKGSVEAYHQLWMSKVDYARSEGLYVMPGVVPTRRELGREAWIVDWFIERGFRGFNVDRYNDYAIDLPDRPSNREHALFLCGLFDALIDQMEMRGSAPMVGAIRAGIQGVITGIGGDRWGGSCASDFVVVEPDGALNNCPDKSTVEASFGSVTDGYQAFALNRFRRKSIRHQNLGHRKSYCLSCENQHFCKSGCPITPNGPEDDPDEVECSGYKTFLTHVRRSLADPVRGPAVRAYLDQQSMPNADAYAVVAQANGQASAGACAA